MRGLISGLMALGIATSAGAMHEPAGLQSDAPTITDPVWDRTVSTDEIVKLYPPAARRLGRTGRAVALCKVTKDGELTDCRLIEETPAGYGFGEATLAAAKLFRLEPRTRSGAPVEGGTVRLPLYWRLAP